LMGICRAVYGKFGDKIPLGKFMVVSGLLCVVSYLLASLSPSPLVSLLGCVLCGFSVAIMWPGTISLCSPKIPMGGTAFFALLAMAGDLGGSAGPALVGYLSQAAGGNLQKGLLFGVIFPVVLVVMVITLSFIKSEKER